jgi:hypothetical protein
LVVGGRWQVGGRLIDGGRWWIGSGKEVGRKLARRRTFIPVDLGDDSVSNEEMTHIAGR